MLNYKDTVEAAQQLEVRGEAQQLGHHNHSY